MGSSKRWPTKVYDDCRYMARTLAVSLQDLDPEQRQDILNFLADELKRLAEASSERDFEDEALLAYEAETPQTEKPGGVGSSTCD